MNVFEHTSGRDTRYRITLIPKSRVVVERLDAHPEQLALDLAAPHRQERIPVTDAREPQLAPVDVENPRLGWIHHHPPEQAQIDALVADEMGDVRRGCAGEGDGRPRCHAQTYWSGFPGVPSPNPGTPISGSSVALGHPAARP